MHLIMETGACQLIPSLQSWKVIWIMTVLEILMHPWIFMCFPLPWKHKQICIDFRSTVCPISLFLTTCVWIHSTELCINHIRLRITENRGLSYPGQCSLLGHYQRLEDNAENMFCSVCMRASVWAHPQRSRPPWESVHSSNQL